MKITRRRRFFIYSGVNILRYSQIKYLGKVSIFWYFGEEFPHFYQCFKTLFQILMKNANNFVESMIYALLLGKSFSLTFGKCFLGFRKIFTPAVAWNSFLWQEVSFCDKKFLPVTWHFCLWQDISSCDKKFLTMAWNSFPWQEVSFCNKKFLLMQRNFFLWKEISTSDKKYLPMTRN